MGGEEARGWVLRELSGRGKLVEAVGTTLSLALLTCHLLTHFILTYSLLAT